MFRLTISDTFCAAHQLKDYKGECEHLHGHNWKVEVKVVGKKLDSQGMLLDFKIIKGLLKEIIQELDHRFLNEHLYFAKVNPTSENIALFIFEKMKKKLTAYPNVDVEEVVVWESETARASYSEKISL